MTITKAQRLLLEAARDHGNAWRPGGRAQRWSPSRQAAINRLVARGLLSYGSRDMGRSAPNITDAGRAIISVDTSKAPAYKGASATETRP